MLTIFSINLLYLLSRLKSQFENSRFQTSDFNPIKSKNTTFIKKTLQSSVLSYEHRIPFDISEVALRLLLIVVAFCTSRGVHLFASWLQISGEGSGLEHIYTCNRFYSFALLHPCKLCSILFPFLWIQWPARIAKASVQRKRFQRKTCQRANAFDA